MRKLAVLLICAAMLPMLPTSPALAFPGVAIQPCDEMPPMSARQPVTGAVWVYDIPSDRMSAQCNKEPGPIMVGCAFLATAKHPAIIFLNASLSAKERACTLVYEKAHLPPNNWVDPVAEARATDIPRN